MRLIATLLTAASLATALISGAAQASPILYTMTFDASNTAAGAAGPNGTGSFLYDASTNPDTMTSLNWNFGAGQTGGITDAVLAGSNGQFLFTSIFQNTTQNSATTGNSLTVVPGALTGLFPDVSAEFCFGTLSSNCHMSNPLSALASYEFVSSRVTFRGYVTVAQATVPEPTTLALVALALGGIGFSSRKRE